MAEPCDCLNQCGDDERVGQYLVEPCECRMNRALREKARLETEVSLHEDAAKWRAFCAVMEVANA